MSEKPEHPIDNRITSEHSQTRASTESRISLGVLTGNFFLYASARVLPFLRLLRPSERLIGAISPGSAWNNGPKNRSTGGFSTRRVASRRGEERKKKLRVYDVYFFVLFTVV